MAGEQAFKAVISGDKYQACPKCGVLEKKNPECPAGKDHKGPINSYKVGIKGSNYNHFLGKKIGDSVDGMFVGAGDQTLSGYKLQITGGSDVTGRPMRPDIDGAGVKSVLVSPGVGYRGKKYVKKNAQEYVYKYDGIRRRRNLRGNIISQDTRQINLKVVETGKRSLPVIFGLEEEAAAETPSDEEE